MSATLIICQVKDILGSVPCQVKDILGSVPTPSIGQ